MCVINEGEETSEYFKCNKGVLQRGFLSPFLFNLYFYQVRAKLYDINVDCLHGSRILNHLTYADELLLVFPSANRLRKLINCCVHCGPLLDIHFNEVKN